MAGYDWADDMAAYAMMDKEERKREAYAKSPEGKLDALAERIRSLSPTISNMILTRNLPGAIALVDQAEMLLINQALSWADSFLNKSSGNKIRFSAVCRQIEALRKIISDATPTVVPSRISAGGGVAAAAPSQAKNIAALGMRARKPDAPRAASAEKIEKRSGQFGFNN